MEIQKTFNSYIESVKTFWQSFNFQEWSEKIGGDSAHALQAAVCFVLSIGGGIFFKKYFKFLATSFLAAVVIIAILQYNNLVVIDWAGLRLFVGLGPNVDVNELFSNWFTWIKANVVIFGASVVGFLIGYKIG